MSPRTGRPTDNPKSERVTVRMAEDELNKLEVCSQLTGKSKTEIIKLGIDKVYNELKK